MKILTNSIGEVKQVCDFFSIPINTAEIEISFPYALELKQIVGLPVEDEREYTFQEFEDRYLNRKYMPFDELDEKELTAFDLPEESKVEIIDKIYAMASSIRGDWTDPRSECREIWRLCKKLKEII